ncbi:type 2 lantibiotic biosynthesis protein LanM [Actinokineospora alba]|uniref:Type 2 lantibiotic biosynthesis protein LanM n=1 Tax=Actinokineospora alba TaxID=504798 RepID=A0A1H0R6Z0_9PSEU|nr:type 2 lanthipeptide synthetase LanM family protein [Actinokineospora alba]TDP70221.1 type 2 lantibiotic biosynthesis protein LanM [Actinokineospora alba]SDI36528.1 type 2 lantibiotic biosynthesis protein LanM [Actinokineospora alba]SDP25254.1 type 2 lantibiotic biosynthesis protein LanM [Actinokineospora alba]
MTSRTPRGTVHRVTGQPNGGEFPDPAWWAPGIALHERRGTEVDAGVLDAPAAAGRLDRWRAVHGSAEAFERRLAETGLHEKALAALLCEPPVSLASRVDKPTWAETVERALASAPVGELSAEADWRDAFAVPLRPLVSDAVTRLAESVRGLAEIDLDAVARGFADRLSRDLVETATATLVANLGDAAAAGLLTGADGAQRFTDYVRRLTRPANLAAFLAEYPVLARLLGQAADFAVEAHTELLTRLAADRAAVVASLFDGRSPGRLVGVEARRGDLHRRGRSVAILTFADGRRVVYRPRDVRSHVRFGELVGLLNHAVPDLALRTVDVVERPGYGWLEFIETGPLPDLAAADRFYRRQGALLALLHLVHAADIHFENLIASGDQPVLVDMETLFHPRLATPIPVTDPAAAALSDSVYRTSLLPVIVVGENGAIDVSGMGGDRGAVAPDMAMDWEFPGTDRMRPIARSVPFRGADNRPRLAGRDLAPEDHETALLDGFGVAYEAVMRHHKDFAALVESCADVEVRVIARPTRGYVTLIEESTHPDLLRDALDRDRVLDLLWSEAAGDPGRRGLSRHEVADLWAGDIPIFTGKPGSADLWTSEGHRVSGVIERTGLSRALEKVGAGSEADRRDQAWIISATLATRRPAAPGADVVPLALAGTAADPQRLVAEACALGDQIIARSMGDRDRVNWLGLELVDDRQWLVLPMGASMANGYLGVALFLAQLADLTGISRYADVASRAVGAIPAFYDTVAARPDLVPVIGCGGLHGFGGIAYTLTRLATLLADTELGSWAEHAVDLATAATRAPGSADWATGSAGCLAAMTAVHTESGCAAAGRLAASCAEELAEYVEYGDLGPHHGFADGAAGIAWALGTYGRANADGRATRAAREAITGAPQSAEPGWHSGEAGRCVARCLLAEPVEDRPRPVTRRPVLRDLSLCHGELGVVDTLTVLAAADRPGAARAMRRRAGLVLDALDRYGPVCGTPGGVFTPGLLTGAAGIGYGLLRLAHVDRVPSVLMLQPGCGPA